MQTLVREPIQKTEFKPTQPDEELRARSAKVLRYDGFEAARLADTRAMRSAEIRQWLFEKDIRPFSAKSVARYMTLKKWMPEFEGIVCISILLALVLIGSSILKFCNLADTIGGNLGFIGAFLLVLLPGTLLLTGPFVHSGLYAWNRSLIYQYTRPIPEFALQTAIDVKERFPESDVDCLIVELQTKEMNYDPFLAIRLPDQSLLYLEVWNEPGFKQVREV